MASLFRAAVMAFVLLASPSLGATYKIPKGLPSNTSIPILGTRNPASVMNLSDYAGCEIVSGYVATGNSNAVGGPRCFASHMEVVYVLNVKCPKKHPMGAGDHSLRMGGGMVGANGIVNDATIPIAQKFNVPTQRAIEVYLKLVEEQRNWENSLDGKGPEPAMYWITGETLDGGICTSVLGLDRAVNCRNIAGEIYNDLKRAARDVPKCKKDSECEDWGSNLLPSVRAWTTQVCEKSSCVLRGKKGANCSLIDMTGKRVTPGLFEYTCGAKLKCTAVTQPDWMGKVKAECR